LSPRSENLKTQNWDLRTPWQKRFITIWQEEAFEAGEARGIARGEAHGIALEKARLAKNLLASGFPAEKIAEITELSLREVLDLSSAITR